MSVIPDDFTEIDKLIGYKRTPKPVSTKVAGYRPLERTTGNKDYDRFYDEEGRNNDIDPNLLFAQGFTESTFNPKAKSPKNARGIAQFIPDTAAEFGVNVNDPRSSINGQARLMRKLLDRTGDIDLALAGYNSGHNLSVEALRRNKERIPETRAYVAKIRKDYGSPAQKIADNTNFDDIDKLIGYGKFAKTPVDDFTEIDALIGYQPTAAANTTPQDPSTVYGMTDTDIGATATPATPQPSTTPVPESPDALQAQINSTFDANSPKAMTLLTKDNPANNYFLNTAEAKRLTRVDTPNGIVLVNTKKLGIKPSEAAEYVKKNGFAKDSGFVIDMGNNTGDGQPAVAAIDPNTGKEVFAAVTPDPVSAQIQAQKNAAMFPGTLQVPTNTDEVVANRLDEGVAPRAYKAVEGTPPRSDRPRTQEDINAEFEQWITVNGLPRNNDSVAKFNAFKQAEVDDENEIIRAMNVASDTTNLGIIGESIKEGKSAKDALARQAEIQKRFETEKAANPALTVEQFNATLQAEAEQKFLSENATYADFLKQTGLPNTKESIDEFNTAQKASVEGANKQNRIDAPRGQQTTQTATKQRQTSTQQTNTPLRPPASPKSLDRDVRVEAGSDPRKALESAAVEMVLGQGYDVDAADVIAAYRKNPNALKGSDDTQLAAIQKSGGVIPFRLDKSFIKDVFVASKENAQIREKYKSDILNTIASGGDLSEDDIAALGEKGVYFRDLDPNALAEARQMGEDSKRLLDRKRNEYSQQNENDFLTFGHSESPFAAEIKARRDAGQLSQTDATIQLLLEDNAWQKYVREHPELQSGTTKPEGVDRRDWDAQRKKAFDEYQSTAQDVSGQYGSFRKKLDEESRVAKEYENRPLAAPIEFAKSFGRQLAKIPSTALKAAGLAIDLTDPTDSSTAFTKILYAGADDWTKKVDKEVDLLKQNKDFRNDFIVNDVATGAAQFVEQLLLAPISGGLSLALPIAEAVVDQDTQARTAGVGKVGRAAIMVASGLAAVPDALLKAKYLRGLNPEQVTGFIGKFTDSLFNGLAKKVGEVEARTITAQIASNYLPKAFKAAGNAAFNYYAEKTQERWEDKINNTVAKLVYKPDQEINKTSKAQERGYDAAGILGLFGAGIETATETLGDSELQRLAVDLPTLLREQKITPEQATDMQNAVEKTAKKRGVKISSIVLQPLVDEKAPSGDADKDNIRSQAKTEKPKVTLEPVEDIAKSDKAEPTPKTETQSEPVSTLQTLANELPEGKFRRSVQVRVKELSDANGDPVKSLDAIHRIKKNLAALDPQNRNAIEEHIQTLEKDLLESQGYTALDMKGKSYDERMNVEPNFKPDDSLYEDEKVITRVIAPAIYKDGKIVRIAKVEVSLGQKPRSAEDVAQREEAAIQRENAARARAGMPLLPTEPNPQKPIDTSPVRERAKAKAAEKFGVKGKVVDEAKISDEERNARIEARFHKDRRDWIDKERETNPTFAPDSSSAKELLSPAEQKETVEYEALRHKSVAKNPDDGYRDYKMTRQEKSRLVELEKKYRHIYFTPETVKRLELTDQFEQLVDNSGDKPVFKPNVTEQQKKDFADKILAQNEANGGNFVKQPVLDLIKPLAQPKAEAASAAILRERAQTDANKTGKPFVLFETIEQESTRQPKSFDEKVPKKEVRKLSYDSEAGAIKDFSASKGFRIVERFTPKAEAVKEPRSDARTRLAELAGKSDTLQQFYQRISEDGWFDLTQDEIRGTLGIDEKTSPMKARVLAKKFYTSEGQAYRKNATKAQRQAKIDANVESVIAQAERANAEMTAQASKAYPDSRNEKATNLEAAKAKVEGRKADAVARRNEHPVDTFIRHYNQLGGGRIDNTMQGQIARAMTPKETAKMKSFIDNLGGEDFYDNQGKFLKQVKKALSGEVAPAAETAQTESPVKKRSPKPKVTEADFQEARKELNDYRDSLITRYGDDWGDKSTPDEIAKFKDLSARERATAVGKDSALRSIPETDPLQGIITDRGTIDYERAKDVAGRIERGEAKIERLDADGERGRIAGGRRAIEASLILAANERASEGSGSRTRPVERQERALEEYAKREGIWIAPRESGLALIGKGVEAKVYGVAGGKSVQKVIDYKQIDKHATPLDFIDNRIAAFNQMFPDTAYELVGFTRTKDGFRFVINQPFIQDTVYTTAPERQAFMKKKGFEMVDRYGEQFANRFYHVSDLHEKNALIKPDGTILVIDAVTKAKPISEFAVVPAKDEALRSVAVPQSQIDAVKEVRNADGKLLAPNGKVSNLNERQWKEVRTPNFINYFGDWINDPENASKVVDENGEPLVVYHGTPTGGFDTFEQKGRRDPGWMGKAFYFTENKSVGETFKAKSDDIKGVTKRRLYQTYLSASKPLKIQDLPTLSENEVKNALNAMRVANGREPLSQAKWLAVWFDLQHPVLADNDIKLARHWQTFLELPKLAQLLGYDSLYGDMEGGTWAVFEPNQIKSATSNNGNFDPNDPSILRSIAQTPFYSRVESVIRDKMPHKATSAQVTALLAKNSVKELDPEFQALKVWLDDQGNVSKDDVLAFIAANKTAVSEVVKGKGELSITPHEDEPYILEVYRANDPDGTYYGNVGEIILTGKGLSDFKTPQGKKYAVNVPTIPVKSFDTQKEAEDYIKANTDLADETSFAQWQLPGESENYREEFLTAPEDVYGYHVKGGGFDSARFQDKAHAERQASALREAGHSVTVTPLTRNNWKDGHSEYSDIVNPIARIRYNDRTTTDGDKMLFAEEFQQPGKGNFEKMPKVYQKYGEQMAIRKMLYRAVEGGYDYFGFTTGQQQADRYNLSTKVERINVEATETDGVYFVDIHPIEGGTIYLEVEDGNIRSAATGTKGNDELGLTGKPLADVIGKDMAGKILAVPQGELDEFSGDDLKIGGTGLINRYDRKHVDYINKLMKPYGVQVESKDIATGIKATKKGLTSVEKADLRSLAKDANDLDFEDFATQYRDITGLEITEDQYEELGDYMRDPYRRADAISAFVEGANENLKESEKGDVTIHAVRISPEFRKAVEASIREHGGAFPLFKIAEPGDIAEIESHIKGNFRKVFTGGLSATVKGDELGKNQFHLDDTNTIAFVHQMLDVVENKTNEPSHIVIAEGIYLNPRQVNDMRDAILGTIDAATDKNIDTADAEKFLKTFNKAVDTKHGDMRVVAFDGRALGHETAHQQSERGAGDKNLAVRRSGLRDLVKGTDTLSRDFQTAGKRWAKIQGVNSDLSKLSDWELGRMGEEVAVYIADGRHTDLGLSYAKAVKLGVELQLRYAEARIQENPELTVREALATFEGTILQPFSEQVYEREQSGKSDQSNVESKGTGREIDQGDNAGDAQSDGDGVSSVDTSEQETTQKLQDLEADYKNRKYADTLRENGFTDVPNVPYIPGTDKHKADEVNRIIGASKDDNYVSAEKIFYDKHTDPALKGVLGTALIDHLGSVGEIERMVRIANDTVEHFGTAGSMLQAAKLAAKYDFATGMMMVAKAKARTGKHLTVKEVNKAEQMLGDVAKTAEERAALVYMVDEMKQQIADAEAREAELAQSLIEAQEAKELSEKEARRAERVLANYKRDNPKTRRTNKVRKLADLDAKAVDLEAILREAFKTVAQRSVADDTALRSIPENPAVYEALVDMAARDILRDKTPEETLAHLKELSNGELTQDEMAEIQADAFESTKGHRVQLDADARKKIANRKAHEKMARETRPKGDKATVKPVSARTKADLNTPSPKPTQFESQIMDYGKENGYADAEIVGAILMPKLRTGEVVEQWNKLMGENGTKETFKRSYELRQKAVADIKQKQLEARLEKEGNKETLDALSNRLIHNGIAGRTSKQRFDAYAKHLARGWGQFTLDAASEAVSVFKGLTTWGEVSYVLRQGLIPLITDTRAAVKADWQGIGHGLQGDNAMWKYLANKAGFEDVAEYLSNHSAEVFIEKIRQHPRFLEAQNNGARFTQIGDFNIADDHFSTRMLEKIPLYRRTELAYTLPGDLQRLYMYDNFAKIIEDQNLTPQQTKEAKKYAAETVNAFTGKGDIGHVLAKGGAFAKVLNLAFFSPQLLASRFQSFNRLTTGFVTAPKGMKLQMAKKGLRFYGFVGLLALLTGMVIDPDDDDFGKIEIKKNSRLAKAFPNSQDAHIDLLGGMDVPMQLYFRTALGLAKSLVKGDKGYFQDAMAGNMQDFGLNKQGEPRFARGKLAPGASIGYDLYKGSDFLGRPLSVWGELTTRMTPMAWQQIYDAALYDRYKAMVKEPQTFENAKRKLRENDVQYLNAVVTMLMTGFGAGLTQYPKDDPSKAMQLARTLSPTVSKKDAETLRQEGGLRNLLKAQNELQQKGESTAKVDKELARWRAMFPNLASEFGKINGQADSKTGLLSYYIKDLNADQLKRVREKATDPDEIRVIERAMKRK